MKSYLSLAARYLSAHKKKTRLTIFSVALSVALVTGVFSMMDVMLQFEKIQMIHDYGNYHLAVKNASIEEKQIISSRVDVKNSGTWVQFKSPKINGISCAVAALDQNFAKNLDIKVIEGQYPNAENEIMLEQWAADSSQLSLNIGDAVNLAWDNGVIRQYKISGIYNDIGNMKAKAVPGVFISATGAASLPQTSNLFLIEFKDKANINQAEKDIKSSLNISEDRIVRNDHLLAVLGQSEHQAAKGFYTIGSILFLIVLLAGVVMIYNTFNISVMERVRHFGFLRCIGASQSQIRKLVRQEGLAITLKAIPIGVIGGLLMTLICSAMLKYYNSGLFGEIPLFTLSPAGLATGVAVGIMTVFIATLLPAKKASRVSPVNAATGSNEIKISKAQKKGLLTQILPVEFALGINNAVMRKKTLILMACSIGLSIVMFLGFNVFVNFMHTSMKTTKPYTPDITLTTEKGLSGEYQNRLSGIEGISKVYGRMFSHVEAAFDASRLTQYYLEKEGSIQTTNDGLLIPTDKSWLISYDQNQLQWAKTDLIEGEISEEKLNNQNGIIAVISTMQNNITSQNTNLKIGDEIYINTVSGERKFTVQGILRTVPFSDSEKNLTNFITTEKIFTELTGKTTYDALDIQLQKNNQEQTLSAIKGLLDPSIKLLDSRQKNSDMNKHILRWQFSFTDLWP